MFVVLYCVSGLWRNGGAFDFRSEGCPSKSSWPQHDLNKRIRACIVRMSFIKDKCGFLCRSAKLNFRLKLVLKQIIKKV